MAVMRNPAGLLNYEENPCIHIRKQFCPSRQEAEAALETIGYYRLRGYCYHLYDNEKKQYRDGTNFSDIISLYRFDEKLSHLIFEMLSAIEVALRVRLTESLLTYGDSLILNDPA